MPFLGKFASSLLHPRTGQDDSARHAAREDGIDALPVGVQNTVCGAPGCTGGWMRPWRSRLRPIFEDEWGCSGRCLQTMVDAAVRREMMDSSTEPADAPHRHRVPLGLVLLAQGWITHPELQTALAAQRATGEGKIGDWLTRNGLPEERIARGLGVQWNCPVLTLQGFSPSLMALVMPKRFVVEFGLVPIRSVASTILYVAFQERLRAAAALGLEHICRLRVENGLLTSTQLDSARMKLLASDSVPVRIRQVSGRDELTGALVKLLEQNRPVGSRLVRIHQYYWMRMWMEETAMPRTRALQATIEDTEDHLFMVG